MTINLKAAQVMDVLLPYKLIKLHEETINSYCSNGCRDCAQLPLGFLREATAMHGVYI